MHIIGQYSACSPLVLNYVHPLKTALGLFKSITIK